MRAFKWVLGALGVLGALVLGAGVYLYTTAPERAVRVALEYERRLAGLERKEITLAGGLTYVYLEGGRGAALLLLHGFGGEVAGGAFEGGLGDAHDVVAGDDLLGAVVAHGEDAAAAGGGHLLLGAAGHGGEGVGGDVDGAEVDIARGIREAAGLEPLTVGEGDGVDEEVEAVVALLVEAEEFVQVVIAGGIQRGEHGALVVAVDGLDGAPGAAFVLLAGEVGEGEGGAVLGEGVGDVPGVGALVSDADDEA
jgi:hypothetical protein